MNVLEISYRDRLYPLGENPPAIDSEEARTVLVEALDSVTGAYLNGQLEGWQPFRFHIIDDETGLAPDDPGKIGTSALLEPELLEVEGVGIGWLIAPAVLAIIATLIGLGIGLALG